MGHHDPDSTLPSVFKYNELAKDGKWKDDRGDGLHHCWYCGSISADDLLKIFEENRVSQFSGSDWKYGYPHKFYIDLDTGVPAQPYYTVNGANVSKEIYDRADSEPDFMRNASGGITLASGFVRGTGTAHLKFYTEHLLDIEDKDLFKRIADVIEDKFKIHFENREGKLYFRAPHAGFQV